MARDWGLQRRRGPRPRWGGPCSAGPWVWGWPAGLGLAHGSGTGPRVWDSSFISPRPCPMHVNLAWICGRSPELAAFPVGRGRGACITVVPTPKPLQRHPGAFKNADAPARPR